MAYDLKQEEEVKEYIENLGIEYRFGCYKEQKPEVCHLLGDYLEAIKKDYDKAAKVFKSNCLDYKFGKSCLKIGNYTLVGRGREKGDHAEALKYFEKGCEYNEPGACLHAGLLLTATGPGATIPRDVPKGYNYLKKSCDQNDPMACHYLFGMYLTGVPKNVAEFNPHNPEKNKNIEYIIKSDKKQAFQFAKKACELGHMYACANVSMMYKRGDGVEQNADEAKRFFEIAQALQKAHETTKEIGIIGGSGFDDPTLFENQIEKDVTTPFGKPSDVLIEGQIKGVPCVLLARHGRKHQFQPSDVNYRANIWALKQVGCTHILATTATGSLVEEYKPGDLVILNDFIDRTWGRKCTFYDRTEGGPKGVCHLPMRPAFCERARNAMITAAKARGYSHHETGTAVVIQGPRFSSRAESLMHRQWGGHLVNMTTVPEVTNYDTKQTSKPGELRFATRWLRFM
ncbi:unnamed protein product [Spodoptera littoralis]|uniref:Nucleoside phosphorylase domain-containing protein n=1 Tax=Spodoptera littoralis TaxID=7109 RepID=A0A9P0IAL4_SPOLI|nr:unnamed protein product [Spodoptera littoralis]CAH1641789.1 unnamed protein product [Spodoptera littoralis]